MDNVWVRSSQLAAPAGQALVISVLCAVGAEHAFSNASGVLRSDRLDGLDVVEAIAGLVSGTALVLAVLMFGKSLSFALSPDQYLSWYPTARIDASALQEVRGKQVAHHLLRVHYVNLAHKALLIGLVALVGSLAIIPFTSSNTGATRVWGVLAPALCALALGFALFERPRRTFLRNEADLIAHRPPNRYAVTNSASGRGRRLQARQLTRIEVDAVVESFGHLRPRLSGASASREDLQRIAYERGVGELYDEVVSALLDLADGCTTTADSVVPTVATSQGHLPLAMVRPGLSIGSVGVATTLMIGEASQAFLHDRDALIEDVIASDAGVYWSTTDNGLYGFVTDAPALHAVLDAS